MRLRLSAIIASLAVAVGIFSVPTVAAATEPPRPAPPGIAEFEGRQIDLQSSWEEAESCVVFGPGEAKCFRTNEEANAAANAFTGLTPPADRLEPATRSTAAAAFDCTYGWLCLFGSTGGYGRRLIFSDDHWQSLDTYNFGGLVRSWRNNQTWCHDSGMLGDRVGGVLILEGCARGSQLDTYWRYAAVDVHG